MNWQYVAGFTDAEGCIHTRKDGRNIVISWTQSEPQEDVLRQIQVFLDEFDVVSLLSSQDRGGNTNIAWRLVVNRRASCSAVLKNILPFLVVKHKAAVSAVGTLERVGG